MFWFDKHNPLTVYMDNRDLTDTLCDGRMLEIKPDVLADFRHMPFEDGSFRLAVFDPPHLIRAGESSWLAKKYGVLSSTWESDIKQGFLECMRVLEPHGVLIFKWNTEQVQLSELFKVVGHKPLFGDKRGKTHWLVWMKEEAIWHEICTPDTAMLADSTCLRDTATLNGITANGESNA